MSRRTDYVLDDLFLDYSLPRDGRSFFEAKSTLGDKFVGAIKTLWDNVVPPTGVAVEGSVGPAMKPSHLLRNLQHTCELFAQTIPELGRNDPAIATAAHVFQECVSVFKSIPPIVVSPSDDLAKQNRHSTFSEFLGKFLPRVRQLAPGTSMLVPAGWLVPSGAVAVCGNLILLVLHRRLENPDEFSVSVCNSGQGLSFHPVRADGCGELRLVPLVLKSVKRDLVVNGTFWALLFKSIIYPHEKNSAKFVYSSVLSCLNGIPIDSNLVAHPEVVNQGVWLPPAEGGDKSGAICASFALFAILSVCGKSSVEAQWISFVLLRKQLLISSGDLSNVSVMTRGLMLKSLAWHAFRLKELSGGEQINTIPIEEFIENSLQLRDPHESTWLAPKISSNLRFAESDTHYWLFDRVANMEEVESQAGKPRPPKVLIPVPIAEIRDTVSTVSDLCELWSHTVHCCALLQNQQTQIPHAQALVFGLIVHVISRVTPPVGSSWWSVTVREDTRLFLLRNLALITGHFASSSFSLGGRAIDGGRIVVSCALMALCDLLCRKVSTDSPSVFALHYSGLAAGPVSPFGLGPGMLAEETACSLLLSPDLVTARCTILEYFSNLKIDADHQIFKFDERVDFGTAEFLLVEQLCLAMGMHEVIPESPYLLSGEKKDLQTYFPELVWLRDVCFLSKILMNPDGEKLPPIKPVKLRTGCKKFSPN